LRALFWYCNRFGWKPAVKTLEQAPEAEQASLEDVVAAFVHVEPDDVVPGSSAETKLVKNAKWLARKWSVNAVALHSFTHLGEDKAPPDRALALLLRAKTRLEDAGYDTTITPYGYYNDLIIDAPGHPLARIYKSF
jgi:hypothetical protein